MPKGNRRIASTKPRPVWDWEQKQMEILGFELLPLDNNRMFFVHKEHGQMVRRKNAKRYLKEMGYEFDNRKYLQLQREEQEEEFQGNS